MCLGQRHHHQQQQQLPCLHCQPHTFLRTVQHLIERCLLLKMSREDCVRALEVHAGIQPVVTATVWKELLKENEAFFQAYDHDRSTISAPDNFSRESSPTRDHNHQKSPFLEIKDHGLSADIGGSSESYLSD